MALHDPDNYIIDTRTVSAPNGRDFEFRDLLANEEYKLFVELQEKRKLAAKFPEEDRRIREVASNFHQLKHMGDETLIAKTDEDGLIYVKDEAMARQILQSLQSVDSEVKLSKYGKQFEVQGLPAAKM